MSGTDKDLSFGDGDDGTQNLWSSLDGVTFTPGTLPFEAMRGTKVVGLAAMPSGFVMVVNLLSGPTAIYTSPDGQAWTETSTPAPCLAAGLSLVALPAGSGWRPADDPRRRPVHPPDGVTSTGTPTAELEGVLDTHTAAALPDGRIVLDVEELDGTAESGHSRSVLVGTPQP